MTHAIFGKDGFTELGQIKVDGKMVTATTDGVVRAMRGWLVSSAEEWIKKNGWKIVEVRNTADTKRRRY